MGRRASVFSAIVLAMFCVAVVHSAEPLLLVSQPCTDALFVGCKEDGSLEFQIADATRTVSLEDHIRWSNPQSNLDHHEVLLVDGSRLVLAESWAGKDALKLSSDTLTILTARFGKSIIPRHKLQAILINAPTSNPRRTQLRDQLVAHQGDTDRLWLTNGDTLAGQVLEIGLKSSAINFNLDGASESISLPIDRVAGIAFGASPISSGKGRLAIGWRDGSYLVANSLVTKAGSLNIELACAVELTGDDLHHVVYLQSLSSRAVYLSDLEATDYRHTPFLNIPWQYERDRNLFGGPLTVSQLIYAKGLAMHTASRLTYEIPRQSPGVVTTRLERFVSQCAIDDSAKGRGSVVFQVFLRQKGEMRLALATPVIRGGDAPLPISVELADSEQIVLVVEYADRGDQLDHANWLDARLE